jgi:hypothetical protein
MSDKLKLCKMKTNNKKTAIEKNKQIKKQDLLGIKIDKQIEKLSKQICLMMSLPHDHWLEPSQFAFQPAPDQWHREAAGTNVRFLRDAKKRNASSASSAARRA